MFVIEVSDWFGRAVGEVVNKDVVDEDVSSRSRRQLGCAFPKSGGLSSAQSASMYFYTSRDLSWCWRSRYLVWGLYLLFIIFIHGVSRMVQTREERNCTLEHWEKTRWSSLRRQLWCLTNMAGNCGWCGHAPSRDYLLIIGRMSMTAYYLLGLSDTFTAIYVADT